MACKLATAFDKMRENDGIDARHHFTCCQSCGSTELSSLEDPNDATIGYCFYHAQDADNIIERKHLYLSYGGFETFDDYWEAEEVADIIKACLISCGLDVEWNGKGCTRLKVMLDAESADFVSALADGYADGVRVLYDWKYFDFDKEWDRFAEIWYTDEVQTILQKDVREIEENDGLIISHQGKNKICRQPWKKGDALWQMSTAYYTSLKLHDDIANDPVNDLYASYRKVMMQFNRRLCLTQDDFYDSPVGIKCVSLAASQRRNVEGLVYTEDDNFSVDRGDCFDCFLTGMPGRSLVNGALSKVAERMFPDTYVTVTDGPEDSQIVFVPDKCIVFDLVGHYFSKQEMWSGFAVENIVNQFRLNQVRSGLENE